MTQTDKPTELLCSAWIEIETGPIPELDMGPLDEYINSKKICQRDIHSETLIDPSDDIDRAIMEVDHIAIKERTLIGKWIIRVGKIWAADTWERIRAATLNGYLGIAAKISLPRYRDEPTQVICVYTYNYLDHKDVQRVREYLRDIGFTDELQYKPDIYTFIGIYDENDPYGKTPTLHGFNFSERTVSLIYERKIPTGRYYG